MTCKVVRDPVAWHWLQFSMRVCTSVKVSFLMTMHSLQFLQLWRWIRATNGAASQEAYTVGRLSHK